MLIHWLRRESKGKRSLWGLVQVKGKKLWINWESTGGTLKTDKGKKQLWRKTRQSTYDNSCHFKNSHGLSSCYVTGPGLDALSTLNLSSYSPINGVLLYPILMGKWKKKESAIYLETCLVWALLFISPGQFNWMLHLFWLTASTILKSSPLNEEHLMCSIP